MATSDLTLALLHHSFGPYHVARARALHAVFPGTLRCIQLAQSEEARAWQADVSALPIDTAVEGKLDSIPAAVLTAGLERLLGRIKPDVLAIAGYYDAGMRKAATWARRHKATAVLMSDSQARDWPRRRWREWVKRRWIERHFQAAFVSGAEAALYAESLGIPGHRIWRGYDVVDNDHFQTNARSARADADRLRAELGLPRDFFLYVGRFAPEKNLALLLEAFGRVCDRPALKGWALAMVGSGPLEAALRQQAAPLGDRVRFSGFVQVDRLPSYYGLASALILPSLSEPWGLVVNEAMASGLPVVVSRQCGCALDLVFPGVNGIIFDPSQPRSLEDALVAIASDAASRQSYGEASARIVGNFSLHTWAAALTGCCLALGGTMNREHAYG